MKTYRIGDLAYMDSFSGLIPCKVTAIDYDDQGYQRLTVKVTANRKGYKRGDIQKGWGSTLIVPRDMVHIRAGQYRIFNNYQWSR